MMPLVKYHFLVLLVILPASLGSQPVHGEFPLISADFSQNGQVDLADYVVLSSSWTSTLPWFPDGLLWQMLAHWPLDQNGMDSQNTYDGISYGNPIWFTKKMDPGEVKIGNGSVGLDGEDYIEIETSRFPPFFNSFTLEVWIKTSYTLQTQTIISRGNSSWQMGVEASTGKAFLSGTGLTGTNYLAGNSFIADGNWHHVAGVYNHLNEMLYIYLDGQIDAQANTAGQVNAGRQNIWMGGNPQTAGDWWHGTLDNICVYNHALTLEQCFLQQTYHVDGKIGRDEPLEPDPEWGKGREKPFKTIQHAIDIAADGDKILVWPGFYQESLFYMGKAVSIRSAADAAILAPDPADPDGIAVTFLYGEQSGSILEHFVIVNCNTAIWIHQSSPTLRHLTIVNNTNGIETIFNSLPNIEHCIFWNNTANDIIYNTYAPVVAYSCLQDSFPGSGNFSSDPLFVNPDSSDPNTMDFHLRSEYGRYHPDGTSEQRPLPEQWIFDNQTSPCIDAGCPTINPLCETMCNGGRINIGADGNRPFASKSLWPLPADLDQNGYVFLEDLQLFSQQWLNTAIP